MNDDLRGMTVNERLYHLGLTESFDTAIANRNKSEAISILESTSLSEEQASETVEAIFENPSYYGFK